MKVTLLGSGDPLGMPVPMCDCDYCEDCEERRLRPGVLVEKEDTCVVLDLGPDIREQLLETEAGSVDGFFATHCHFDHFGGLPELHQLHEFADTDVDVYGGEAVREYMDDSFEWVNVDFHELEDEIIDFGGLVVRSFGIEHSEFFPMQGFVVEGDGKKLVYIPDLKSIPDNEVYKDADLLVVDGMYLFKKHIEDDEDHASKDKLREEIEKVNADNVVIVNMSEHFNEMSVEEEKDSTDYMVGEDFMSWEL